MTIICKKCGKQAEGERYTFYHGSKVAVGAEKVGETKSAVVERDGRRIRQFYTNITRESYFLCRDCLGRWSRKKFWAPFIAGASVLIMLIVCGSIFPDAASTDLEKLAAMGLAIGGGLVFLGSFYYLFPPGKGDSRGEEMAVEIAREEIKTSDAFWNSNDYAKLS